MFIISFLVLCFLIPRIANKVKQLVGSALLFGGLPRQLTCMCMTMQDSLGICIANAVGAAYGFDIKALEVGIIFSFFCTATQEHHCTRFWCLSA